VRERLRGAASLAARLAEDRQKAVLFRELATLRQDPDLLDQVATLRWHGPNAEFEEVCRRLRDPGLVERAYSVATR